MHDLKYEEIFFDNIYNSSDSEKIVHLLIIGETAFRNHHGIYGYSRKTTPNLNKIKNEL